MVGVGGVPRVAGSPLGPVSGRAWGGSPRPRPGPGGRAGGRLRGAGAAERSGTEECGVCGVWRRRGGVLWASGVGDGSGDGAAAGTPE